MHTHSPKNRYGYTYTTKIGQTPTYTHTYSYMHIYGYEEDILSAICNIKNKLVYGQKLHLGQAATERDFVEVVSESLSSKLLL